jgi:hypothetical protein
VKNCLHVIKPNRDRIRLDNEDLVWDYFRLTLRKDIRHVLDLFTDDAIIHEPFSRLENSELKVNTIIMITMRLYDLLHCPYSSQIEWIDCYHNKNLNSAIIVKISLIQTIEESIFCIYNHTTAKLYLKS